MLYLQYIPVKIVRKINFLKFEQIQQNFRKIFKFPANNEIFMINKWENINL